MTAPKSFATCAMRISGTCSRTVRRPPDCDTASTRRRSSSNPGRSLDVKLLFDLFPVAVFHRVSDRQGPFPRIGWRSSRALFGPAAVSTTLPDIKSPIVATATAIVATFAAGRLAADATAAGQADAVAVRHSDRGVRRHDDLAAKRDLHQVEAEPAYWLFAGILAGGRIRVPTQSLSIALLGSDRHACGGVGPHAVAMDGVLQPLGAANLYVALSDFPPSNGSTSNCLA